MFDAGEVDRDTRAGLDAFEFVVMRFETADARPTTAWFEHDFVMNREGTECQRARHDCPGSLRRE